MFKKLFYALAALLCLCQSYAQVQHNTEFKHSKDTLGYHKIRTDQNGHILPWHSENRGNSYDHVLQKIWGFWNNMRVDYNGLPYYMNHQVWRGNFNDPRGLGGDQHAMTLSSWTLLYQYLGDEQIKENMKFIADYYLTHSLSPSDAVWPNIPYPYNRLLYSGIYDGDMVIGKNYTQPDKAGSFGYELVNLYKITGKEEYLEHAILIANTLAKHTKKGDLENSPLPFKVNAITGEVGKLLSNMGDRSESGSSSYTTNYAGTLMLFEELQELGEGNMSSYQKAFKTIVNWMKDVPLKTNKWGPFFEDIPGWSDTQINAVTFAWFIMNHQELFPNWQKDVKGIFNWVYERLGNDIWKDYGVKVVNEQTAYTMPGNSHTSRQASMELWYAKLSGDMEGKTNAIRQLNWATYMVNHDGRNCYPWDEVWFTDGYGDYVRHYLRAIAAEPELATDNANRIIWSTSIIQQASYAPTVNKFLVPSVPLKDAPSALLYYSTFDKEATETIRLTEKPHKILLEKKELTEVKDLKEEGWMWQPMEKGGLLTIHHKTGRKVTIMANPHKKMVVEEKGKKRR